MDIEKLPAGRYVVAVSGGVDSVVLLDVLVKKPGLDLIVVHVDHGIRHDSTADRLFVEQLAKAYKLDFYYVEAKLGANASEELARDVRYKFLEKVKKEHRAKAIVTAHHQDDMLETIILNLLRGTKRKGITSLQSRPGLLRPLLKLTKKQLYNYAKAQKLTWREDSTNLDEKYSRNWVRHNISPKMTYLQRQTLLDEHKNLQALNTTIDSLLDSYLDVGNGLNLNRKLFINLPHNIAREVCAMWLRKNGYASFDSSIIEKLTVNLKTLAIGKKIDTFGGSISITPENFVFNSSKKKQINV